MRSKIIKLAVLVSVGISTLAMGGCSRSGPAEKVAMGRYIEEAVALENIPEDMAFRDSFFYLDEQKRLNLYLDNGMGCKIFKESAPDQWEEIEDKRWENLLGTEGDWGTGAAVDSKGQPYYITTNWDAELQMSQNTMATYREGKVERTPLKDEAYTFSGASQMELLNNGNFLVSSEYSGITECKLSDGSIVRKYLETGRGNFLVADEELYIVNAQNSEIQVYSLESGQLEKSIECTSLDENSYLLQGKEEDLYLVSKKGIEHLNKGGSIWERFLDGELTSMSLPTYALTAVCLKEDVFYLSFIDDKGKPVVKRYSYSETTPSMPTTQLTAYSLQENKALREAIVAYQLQNLEVKVNLEIGLGENEQLGKEEAITALNTRLLAGEGPDFLVLDGLPINSYMEKGILKDITQATKDIQFISAVDKLYGNEEGIFGVATRFKVPILAGDKKALEQAGSLEALANYQKSAEGRILSKKTTEELIRSYFPCYNDTLFSAEGRINKERLKAYLENIKVVNDAGANDIEMRAEYGEVQMSGNAIFELLTQRAQLQLQEISGIFELMRIEAVNQKKGNCMNQVLSGSEKGSLIPKGIMGINDNTKASEVCEALLKVVLEENNQLLNTGEGFPTTVSAFEKWIDGAGERKDMMYSIGFNNAETGEEVMLDIEWGYEEARAWLKETVEGLEKPQIIDENLVDILVTYSMPYFNGEQTIEQVVDSIAEKVQRYLEE